MIRRNTRGGKTRLAGPPSSRTRPGEWDEELRAALEVVAAEAKREKEASRSSAATTTKKGAAKAGEKKPVPPPSSSLPLPPPPPPPPPPHPALDREETFARGTLMLQPMHKSTRKVEARGRRRARRALLFNLVLAAADAAGRAKAELDAAALAKREAEQQGRGKSHLRKLEDRRQELRKKHAEAAKRVREAHERYEAARQVRKLRLRAKGKLAAEDEETPPESDDTESDFSDYAAYHWERKPRALVSGRCWVDLRDGTLEFQGERQEVDEDGTVTRHFFLKNTQITPQVPGPLFPGEEEKGEPFPDTFALELAEFPPTQRNVGPDPEEASGDLRDALARPAAVEERRVGRTARMRAAEKETTFDLRVVVQQLTAEEVEIFLSGQPLPPPQSPPFVLPFDEGEVKVEEVEEEEEEGEEKEGGKGKQRSAPPPSSLRPPVPPIEIKAVFGGLDDIHNDFYEFLSSANDADDEAEEEEGEGEEGTSGRRRRGGAPRMRPGTRKGRKTIRAIAFRLQALRVPSTQPRRLAAAAAAAAASYAPGGPFAKEAPQAMQQATLLLDSAEDFEKVVLALRVAEEAAAKGRALDLALSLRRKQAEEAERPQQLLEWERLNAMLRAQGLRLYMPGGGGLGLPPAEPVVVECARLRACGDDAGYLNDLNPVKLMYSLSPAARGAFRGAADRGRGMNPFDLQLPSDWEGRDARGRSVRIPVVSTTREE